MEITGYWGMLEKKFGRVRGKMGSGWKSISKLQIENDAIEQLPYYLPGPFGFRSGLLCASISSQCSVVGFSGVSIGCFLSGVLGKFLVNRQVCISTYEAGARRSERNLRTPDRSSGVLSSLRRGLGLASRTTVTWHMIGRASTRQS